MKNHFLIRTLLFVCGICIEVAPDILMAIALILFLHLELCRGSKQSAHFVCLAIPTAVRRYGIRRTTSYSKTVMPKEAMTIIIN